MGTVAEQSWVPFSELDFDAASYVTYYNGEPFTGEARVFAADGTLMEVTHYRDGCLHGPSRTLYPDGTVHSEGAYENNRPVGVDREWFPACQPISVIGTGSSASQSRTSDRPGRDPGRTFSRKPADSLRGASARAVLRRCPGPRSPPSRHRPSWFAARAGDPWDRSTTSRACASRSCSSGQPLLLRPGA